MHGNNPKLAADLMLEALMVAALEVAHDDEDIAEACIARWMERAVQMRLHENFPNAAQA